MLDRAHRLTHGEDFTHTIRKGRRAGSRTMVAHLMSAPDGGSMGAPRVGFIVARAVGGAVTRNRVKRQLRHLVRARLHLLPGGSSLVVRALPAAAGAGSAALARDLDSGLRRALGGGAPQ